jgi:predicted nuclease of predicted toxin-antitoxin system
MAKFKVDENLPVEAAELLRQAGHDAITVLEEELEGSHDSSIAAICQQEHRALVTLDKDFADIRTYPPSDYSGLVVIRIPRQDKPSVLGLIERLLPLLDQEQLSQRLWIVDGQRVRIRE